MLNTRFTILLVSILSNVIFALNSRSFNDKSNLKLASNKYIVDELDGELNGGLDKATATYNHRLEVDPMDNEEDYINRDFEGYVNFSDSEPLQYDSAPQIQNFNNFNPHLNPAMPKCNPNYINNINNQRCGGFMNGCKCKNCKPVILTKTLVKIVTKTLTFTNTNTITTTKTKIKLILFTSTVSRTTTVTEFSTVTYIVSNAVTSTTTETEKTTQTQTQVVPTTTTTTSTSTETQFVPTTTIQTETTVTTNPTTTTETSIFSIPFTTTVTRTITIVDIPDDVVSTTSTRSRIIISLTPV
ncbi:hypothetical protein AYI70_g9066 [Smittium culicis]|uniref:Uncharacterized protein n=1 Tax=Smittium culicis TaxID=133412 RepID=A0A1R1XD12_9FUNG|nr:hypothetical protein AYI70_g9066 [Smittium culicis]